MIYWSYLEGPALRRSRRRHSIPCFFGYIGQKRGLVDCYPPPTRRVIVEPFAGSAGYARRWGAGRQVILVEKTEWLARMWAWLIQASKAEILALPLMESIPVGGLRDMDLRPEAKSLIGIKIHLGNNPTNRPTKMALAHQDDGMIMFWNAAGRKAVADAVRWIRKWRVICGDYDSAPDLDATWFVDPPYERLPDMYGSKVDDYAQLGRWCKSRRGQVVVCEDVSAEWLPFEPLPMGRRSKKSSSGSGRSSGQHNKHREAIWVQDRF